MVLQTASRAEMQDFQDPVLGRLIQHEYPGSEEESEAQHGGLMPERRAQEKAPPAPRFSAPASARIEPDPATRVVDDEFQPLQPVEAEDHRGGVDQA